MFSDFYYFKKRYVLYCIIDVFIDSVTLRVETTDWPLLEICPSNSFLPSGALKYSLSKSRLESRHMQTFTDPNVPGLCIHLFFSMHM